MIEVERKYRVNELKGCIDALEIMQAENKGKQNQHDKVFLPKGTESFKNYAVGMPIVRVRIENGAAILTLKAGGDENFTHEVETAVADPDATNAILKALGMEEILEISKTRQLYSCRNLTIACDVVDGLGIFIEIEKLVQHEAEISGALAEIDSFAIGSLGLNDNMIEKERYDVLIERKKSGV